MESVEWYETVYVIGNRTSTGTFDNSNSKVFDKNGFHWIVNEQFYKKCNLPDDPLEWDQNQVSIWMKWAENEYNLIDFNTNQFAISGKQLISDNFCWNIFGLENKTSNDDLWIHICLLKTMHRVYIKCINEECIDISTLLICKNEIHSNPDFNCDLEIWQFLLHLLTNAEYQNVIEWINNEGTFKIIKPNTLSVMWGLIKKNWQMDYKKMASALRYHYGRGIIERTRGKFHYKFVGDIENMIGHSPMEIKNMFKPNLN